MHNQIGYSGHLQGIEDAIAAISFGALVVEKHFTTDNNLPEEIISLLYYQKI